MPQQSFPLEYDRTHVSPPLVFFLWETHILSIRLFLVTYTWLYKRVCPSVGPSVGPSVRWSISRFFNRGVQAKRLSNIHQCPCPTYVTIAVVNTNLFSARAPPHTLWSSCCVSREIDASLFRAPKLPESCFSPALMHSASCDIPWLWFILRICLWHEAFRALDCESAI